MRCWDAGGAVNVASRARCLGCRTKAEAAESCWDEKVVLAAAAAAVHRSRARNGERLKVAALLLVVVAQPAAAGTAELFV